MDFIKGRMPQGAAADALVERALFLACTGYSYTEEKRETTEKGGEKVTRTKKFASPSVAAITLWLTHRMPEKWGEVQPATPENNLIQLLREQLEKGEGDDL